MKCHTADTNFSSFNFIQLRQMPTAAPKLQKNDNSSLQVFQTRMTNPIDSSIFVPQFQVTFLLHAFKNPVFFKKILMCYLVNITEQFTNFNYIPADLKERARTSQTTLSHYFTIAKAMRTPKLPFTPYSSNFLQSKLKSVHLYCR